MGKNKKDYREEVESYTDGDGSESSTGSGSTNSSGGSQSSESESSSSSSERERKRRHVKRKSSKQKKERRSRRDDAEGEERRARRSDAEGEEELEYDDYEKRKRRKLSRHRHEDPERHSDDHVIRGEEHKYRSSSRKHKHHHRKHRHKHRRHKRHRDHSEEKRAGGEKGEGRRGRDDDRRYKDRGEYEAPDRDRDRRPDRDGERRDRKEDKRREKYESRHVRSKWEEEEDDDEEEEDMQWDGSRRIKVEPGVEEEAATRRPLRADQAQRHRDTRRPTEERGLQEGDGNHASENQRSDWGLQNVNAGSVQSGPPGEGEEEEEEEERQKPNLGLTGRLAEDANTYNGVVIKYSQPPEARKPKRRWRWYIFKGDEDLPYLPLHRQSAYLIGRDRKVADIPTDHPSCSKQHAVLQYRLVGYQRNDGTKGRTVKPYILDLESANGTFVNNRKIDARRFVELLEKDVVKFGYSSREYILLHEGSKGDDNMMPDTGVDLSPVSLLRSKV